MMTTMQATPVQPSPPAASREAASRYVYALAAAAEHHIYGAIGLADANVYALSQGNVSALVSDLPAGRIRPTRKNLRAHHRVLRRLMEETTVLPVSFGTVVESSQQIRRLLADHGHTLGAQLERVADHVEMAIRISWDVPNIFEFFVETHPQLRRHRDVLMTEGAEREAMIELGRHFARLLEEERAAVADRLEGSLGPVASEVLRGEATGEHQAANLAFLVRRDSRELFDSAVSEVADQFSDEVRFDVSGPWAPHSFVDLQLEF